MSEENKEIAEVLRTAFSGNWQTDSNVPGAIEGISMAIRCVGNKIAADILQGLLAIADAIEERGK